MKGKRRDENGAERDCRKVDRGTVLERMRAEGAAGPESAEREGKSRD